MATLTAADVPAGTSAATVSVDLSGLQPGTVYHARLVMTNSAGTTTSPDLVFTTPSAAAISGLGSAPTTHVAVRLSSLTITPASFRAIGRRGASVASSGGAVVRYRDTVAATSTFTVVRLVAGHRTAAGTCSVRRIGNGTRAGRACILATPVGSFRHVDQAGSNSLHFTGRVNQVPLAAGRYRLVAVARAGGMTSAPVTAHFQVR